MGEVVSFDRSSDRRAKAPASAMPVTSRGHWSGLHGRSDLPEVSIGQTLLRAHQALVAGVSLPQDVRRPPPKPLSSPVLLELRTRWHLVQYAVEVAEHMVDAAESAAWVRHELGDRLGLTMRTPERQAAEGVYRALLLVAMHTLPPTQPGLRWKRVRLGRLEPADRCRIEPILADDEAWLEARSGQMRRYPRPSA